MSVGWRSTTIGLVSSHCPRALDHYQRKALYDRSVFARGVAAHAVLEDLGHATVARGEGYILGQDAEDIARRTCERLISEGRDFEGEMEPPLPPREVWEGRDMALMFHDEHPARPDAEYEIGVAVSRDWRLCPYDDGAWLRCRIDSRLTRLPSWADEEDSAGGPRLVISDFKSGWQDDARALHSIQRKIQGVLGWIAWGEGHEHLELQVVNFRARQIHSLEVNPHEPEGVKLLKRWRGDIESEIEALDVDLSPDGWRPASPGPACYGCPYLSQCEPAQAFLGAVWGASSRESLARAYAVADAAREHAEKPLREACAEAPVALDGRLVGFQPKEQRALKPEAPAAIVERFLARAKPGNQEHLQAMLPGFVRELGIGVAQAEKVLKYLFEGSGQDVRERRARFLAGLLTKTTTRKFGFYEENE